MNIQLVTKTRKTGDLVVPLFEKEEIPESARRQLSRKDRDFLRLYLKRDKVRGENVKSLLLPGNAKRILILGKGNKKNWNHRKARILVRRIVQSMKTANLKEGTLIMESVAQTATLAEKAKLLENTAAELVIADYAHNEYKETPKEGWPTIHKMQLATDYSADEKRRLLEAVANGVIIGEETNHTRRLSNMPGGDMTPQKLAAAAEEAGKQTKVKVTILDEKQIKKLGMGGVIGVSRGSSEKPRFIIMEYKHPDYKQAPLVLVGKGVTFDTGGLNLKPDKAIHEMHMDMSGGAAVIHGVAAISRLNIPIHVVGLIPAVENMPSGSSYHPGDILRSITGRTIEVLNTDAEGRIILADALGYAKRYNPRLVVDIATLTGAAMVALGQRVSALFTKDEKLEELFRSLGESSGDYLWPMPLWDEYEEDIKGTFGDVANVGKTEAYGGSITAAMFLSQFVSYPWVHIDMAPTMTAIDSDKLAKGAKGTGVRLFTALARHLATPSTEK